MPKGSPERTAARQEEIISACEKLYQTMSFKDITLKEIGNETSFSRPTIYRMKNYSLFFWIMKSFQKNRSLRNWRHPLQTGSSS